MTIHLDPKLPTNVTFSVYLCQQAVKIQILPWSRVLEESTIRGSRHILSPSRSWRSSIKSINISESASRRVTGQVRLAHSSRNGCSQGIVIPRSHPRRPPESAVWLMSSVRSRGGQHQRWGINVRGGGNSTRAKEIKRTCING
ncbi:hypothetical protein DFH09DRAFT_1098089 [Mycena vulgaris]|nr:hypothetical protein DFH09DRAFT_1098089 [Mycena vulgaris]